jgi:hypothetical protein
MLPHKQQMMFAKQQIEAQDFLAEYVTARNHAAATVRYITLTYGK